MRVSRSLTIKQMAMVAKVVVVFTFIFIAIQLFYFVQQNRSETSLQMEKMAASLRLPLSQAILKADINQAKNILTQLQPSGVIGQISIVLPDQFQALHVNFAIPHAIPPLVSHLFSLPIQTSIPLYALGSPGTSQPLAYLVLQADSGRFYHFILDILSTLLTTYLLLALILTVSITWCINRLIVHPIRKIAYSLDSLTPEDKSAHLLDMPARHHDDEIGMLVRSYNRHQQIMAEGTEPISALNNQAQFLASIRQYQHQQKPGALILIAQDFSETVNGHLSAEHQKGHLLEQMEKSKAIIPGKLVISALDDGNLGVIIEEIDDPWLTMKFAQIIMARLTGPDNTLATLADGSLSMGIVMLHPELSAEELFQRAFMARQSAALRGPNQIQFFDLLAVTRQTSGANEGKTVAGGLDTGQFAIWLQPQVDMQSGEVIGAEVLLRQQQPDCDWRLPEGLIERIEDCGLMMTIGNWVLEEACRVLSHWQQRGIMLPLCVNLSVLQLMDKNMLPVLTHLRSRYGIRPGTLTIEVTESRRINDLQAAVSILRPLHEAGVGIALDDFGMGYAGLRDLHYMKSIPVDALKIDKSFIDGLPDDDVVASIIIAMAKTLGVSMIAEGVETESQRQWLLAQGVTRAQGFLFSEALPVEKFEKKYLTGQ